MSDIIRHTSMWDDPPEPDEWRSDRFQPRRRRLDGTLIPHSQPFYGRGNPDDGPDAADAACHYGAEDSDSVGDSDW